MNDHFIDIYAKHGDRYHELIAAEDIDKNLDSALFGLENFKGKRVLDLGSGTGRIPLLLKNQLSEILAIDLYASMLKEQQIHQHNVPDWEITQADLKYLPVESNWADVVTAGWAIGHFCSWYASTWRDEAFRAINEMERSAKPGGLLIIMETMGTGTEQAEPPTPQLAEYYQWLGKHGFMLQTIRTDYEFGSVQRAVELCTFFFGDEMGEKVGANNWSRVPEWTGIWHERFF